MTDIQESANWSPAIMLLEGNTPVLGGLDGPSNTPLKQLANRTAYLKGEVEKRALLVHSHTITGVTGLQAALDGKADASHAHAIAGITGLQAALDGKSATSHTHTPGSLGAAPATHTHSISQISDLQASLNGKAPAVHGHTTSNITGLDTALAGKAAAGHSHTLAELGAAAAGHTHSVTTAQVNNYTSPVIGSSTSMAGLGMVVTPGPSGKVLAIVQGVCQVAGTLSIGSVQLRYGTGPAPVAGQNYTGTVVGYFSVPVDAHGGYSLMRMLTDLAPGVPIWIDVALHGSSGGTVQSAATNGMAMVIA